MSTKKIALIMSNLGVLQVQFFIDCDCDWVCDCDWESALIIPASISSAVTSTSSPWPESLHSNSSFSLLLHRRSIITPSIHQNRDKTIVKFFFLIFEKCTLIMFWHIKCFSIHKVLKYVIGKIICIVLI